MAQSLSKILLHLVFGTKNRKPLIPQELEFELHAYLASECRRLGGQVYRVRGTENHVHLACTLPRTVTVAELLEGIKVSSSAWIKKRDTRCSSFAWQGGYGAFSLGQSQLNPLIRYIDGQREHHRTKSFEDEFLELLRKYDVEHDERYLWK
jgi:putative transposase